MKKLTLNNKIFIINSLLFSYLSLHGEIITPVTGFTDIIHYEPIFKYGYNELVSEEIGFDRRVRTVVADDGEQYQLSDRIQNTFEIYTDSNRFLETGKSEEQLVLSQSSSNALLVFYPSASQEERTMILEKYGLHLVEEPTGYVYEVESIDASPIRIEGEPYVMALWPSGRNEQIRHPMQSFGFPALSPFWRNASIDNGWRQTRIGLLNDNRYPWVYHAEKGWLYFHNGEASSHSYSTDTTYYWSADDGWTKLD